MKCLFCVKLRIFCKHSHICKVFLISSSSRHRKAFDSNVAYNGMNTAEYNCISTFSQLRFRIVVAANFIAIIFFQLDEESSVLLAITG